MEHFIKLTLVHKRSGRWDNSLVELTQRNLWRYSFHEQLFEKTSIILRLQVGSGPCDQIF